MSLLSRKFGRIILTLFFTFGLALIGCDDDTSQSDGVECGNEKIEENEECDNGELNSDTVPDACLHIVEME
ncbi:MAG: hypothetical protein JXR95_09445 [Deltaproteobacteria bacterium]|nr:hypothetical protein [Deltaproteobacteria bacterium]